jgi:hypothetical protein
MLSNQSIENEVSETIEDDTSISILFNDLQESKAAEKGHMESIMDILKRNNEVLRSADQIIEILEKAQQIVNHDTSSDDDDATSSSSIANDVMEKKSGLRISNSKSHPPPPPRLNPSNRRDQENLRPKRSTSKRNEINRSKSSTEDNDMTDRVLAMADRLTNASATDEPSVIEEPDDEEYWRVIRSCNASKGNWREYKQIGGDNRRDEFLLEVSPWVYNKKSPASTVMCDRKSESTRRKALDRRRKKRVPSDSRRYSFPTPKLSETEQKKSIVDRLLKKKTQISMLSSSNTTTSTSQSTPSLLGLQINVRSSKSVGSHRSGRRTGNARVASNASDGDSLESGSIEYDSSSIFVLPSPPIEEISVCASSLSCRSGRSLRQSSESDASRMSRRSGRCRQRQQLHQSIRNDLVRTEDKTWTNKMKHRFMKTTKPQISM